MSAGISLSASARQRVGEQWWLSRGQRELRREHRVSASIGAGSGSGQLGDGGFQECTGLEIEMDVQELIEGGRNDGTVRLVGRGKYSNIVLKRGMLFPDGGTAVERDLGMAAGRPRRRAAGGALRRRDRGADGSSGAVDRDLGVRPRAAGEGRRAAAQREDGEIAIEELTIAHEGLRLRI